MYMMYSGENTFGSLGVGMEEVMEAAVAEGFRTFGTLDFQQPALHALFDFRP